MERQMRKYFLNKTNLSDDEKEKFGKYIYIVLDSTIFKDI